MSVQTTDHESEQSAVESSFAEAECPTVGSPHAPAQQTANVEAKPASLGYSYRATFASALYATNLPTFGSAYRTTDKIAFATTERYAFSAADKSSK